MSEKLSSCKDIVIQSLLVIDLFCAQLVKERQFEFLNLCQMTSHVSLLVCVTSVAGVPQKFRFQKFVKKSCFVQTANFFRRSYFNKV